MKASPPLLSALLLAATAFPSFGDTLVYDSFSYTNGPIADRGGWMIQVGVEAPAMVSDGKLKLASGVGNRQDVMLPWGARLAPSGKIYAAYDLQVTSVANPYYFAAFNGLDSSQVARTFLLKPSSGGDFRLAIGNIDAGYSNQPATSDLVFGTTYRIVVSYDFDTGISKLWVDPASEGDAGLTTPDASVALPLQRFLFRQERELSAQVIDNLIIGTTFAEVLTPPAPSTPVQGPAVEAYAAFYSSSAVLLPEISTSVPPMDWADDLPAPSRFAPSGSVAHFSEHLYTGWGTTFDENKRVGFVSYAKPGTPLNLAKLDFSTGNGSTTSYKWGYRVNEGLGFGPWTFSETYTSASPRFNQGFKTWDFEDFSTTGAVEFALFATAASPSDYIEPFRATLRLISSGLAPAPNLPAGALGTYTNMIRYDINVSEASAVTYNWDTDTLFCIGDEGMELLELTRTGKPLSSMRFESNISPRERRALDDSEGLTYLGNDNILIADERRNLAVLTTYVPGALRTLADLSPSSYAFGPYDGNTGLEGIAYDPINQSIWGVKENAPMRLYEMTDFGLPTQAVSEPIHLRYLNRVGLSQLSDIFVLAQSAAFANDPRGENILLLHRNRSQLVEIDRTGKTVGYLNLATLGRQTIEGLTVDDKGNIYLVAEGSGTAIDPAQRADALFVFSIPKNPIGPVGNGRQRLVGSTGNDEFSGGNAADIFTGNGGMDTYVFTDADSGVDTVTDFKPGVDTLDVRPLLSSLGYTGIDPLADDTLRVFDNNKGAFLQVNVNGDYKTFLILLGLTAEQVRFTHNFQY